MRAAPAIDATADVLASALRGLLPSAAQVAVAPVGGAPVPVHAVERQAMAGAGPRRRQDFYAGRWCAHQALRALGAGAGPIAVGPHGEPQWPAGVVGSIAHGAGWAVAAVARASDVGAVGVDVEALHPPLDPPVERLVLADPERAAAEGSGDPYRSKILFSAKESAYKCLFPATGRLLEPPEVVVELDPARSRFTAVVAGHQDDGESSYRLCGRLVVTHGLILTAAFLC